MMLVAFACLGLADTVILAKDSAKKPFIDLNPKIFDKSTHIDNEWMPLKPGIRLIYEGTTVDDGKTLPHRVVINVTDLTKVIGGVRSVVTWDLDYSDGELVEAEIAFFAQDRRVISGAWGNTRKNTRKESWSQPRPGYMALKKRKRGSP